MLQNLIEYCSTIKHQGYHPRRFVSHLSRRFRRKEENNFYRKPQTCERFAFLPHSRFIREFSRFLIRI